jgi:hypothetical protein
VAQLGARLDGIEEAVGSNPIGSTIAARGDIMRPLPPFAVLLLGILWFPALAASQTAPRVVHVFVALADNRHQGIVPVPAKLGNGDVASDNLYWGAAYGVRTFFRSSADWVLLSTGRGPKPEILERCVFKNRHADAYLVADAYEGSKIREAVTDFLAAAAGLHEQAVSLKSGETVMAGGAADLVAYVGHDAFMDFQIPSIAGMKSQNPRQVIVLACASKQYFASYLRDTGAEPLLWTTGLMAPEAYTLKAALDGWMAHEDGAAIRDRAAQAYDKFQHCGLAAAQKLFTTGW